MPRKKGGGFDPTNTTEDGDYIIGKGRPPESGQFKKGDGRERGRRPKGTNNLATDLREVLAARVKVTVGGKPKKVTRQRSIVMRLADSATKGQISAIALSLNLQQALVDPVLEVDGQIKLEDRDRIIERTSFAEMEVMFYINCKIEGRDYKGDLIGVIPVYKDGTYLSTQHCKDIEAGMKNYGIEMTERYTSFPPKCKLMSAVGNIGHNSAESEMHTDP